MATATATAARDTNPPARVGAYAEYSGTVTITASPDTYATGGLTLSLAIADVFHASPPTRVEVYSETPSGYVFTFVPGTTMANGKLVIQQSAGAAAPLAELTNGAAIPAAISSDTKIRFRATFRLDS